MLTLEEARDRILREVEPLAPIELPLLEAFGCVAAAETAAEYDIPAFSASRVEGFAVRAADVHAATREVPARLRLVGRVPSGQAPDVTVGWGEAVQVEAGAPIPAGADAVVPLDEARLEGDGVAVLQPVEEGGSITPAGREAKAGEVLVPVGRRLGAPELAALARAGQASALAYPTVRVAVLSIGEGLAEPGRPAALGQLREAASFAVYGALREAGAVPYRVGVVPPDEASVRDAVVANLARADCFVCTMGTGDRDLAEGPLKPLGLSITETAMYPGGAHAFGTVEGGPFFVLPGGPVSAFVAFEVLVRPAVLRMMGRRDLTRPEVRAVLEADIDGPSGVTLVPPVRVEHRKGTWRASPAGTMDPQVLHTVVRSNGLALVAAGEPRPRAGDAARVRIFRSLER